MFTPNSNKTIAQSITQEQLKSPQMTSIVKTERELTGTNNSNKVFQPVYNFNISGTNGEQIATDILGIMRKENQKNFNETAFLLN